MNPTCVLATITGRDRPGVTAALFAALAAYDVDVRDVEQIVMSERLIIAVLLDLRGDPGALRNSVNQTAHALGMECEVAIADEPRTVPGRDSRRSHVIVLGHPLRPGALSHVAQRIADRGDSIESVSQLSTEPISGIELVVRSDDPADLRSVLVQAADETGVDIAVEQAGLRRRAKRLVLIDADSVLIRGDPLGSVAGPATGPSLADRAARLAGLPVAEVESACDRLRPMPGATAFVRTLHGLGFGVGIVSGGFTVITDQLVRELGLDFAAANQLEVAEGRLTGRVTGPVIDRAGRAEALRRFAAARRVPMSQTVAVGGCVENTDLLGAAGLGIAFNATSAPRAPVSMGLPYLDTVLFVLGIPPQEADGPA